MNGIKSPSRGAWRDKPEVGSLWGIKFVAALARSLGRPVARAFLWIVTYYFFVSRPDRVRACMEFRVRAGASVRPWPMLRHLLHFSHCALDRLYFLRGELDHFRVYRVGHEHLADLAEKKRGAVLLGCHLGSFEALRAASRAHNLPLFVVADFANAGRLNAVLSLFGDNSTTRFLDASTDPVAMGLKLKEAIDSGGLVAILADRAGQGRSVEVMFLGKMAPLPAGPYLLAAALDCPVYFTTAFYSAPRRYELLCEPLFDRISLPRNNREQAVQSYAQAYAQRLERYAKIYPDNWFNFFSFWSAPDGDT